MRDESGENLTEPKKERSPCTIDAWELVAPPYLSRQVVETCRDLGVVRAVDLLRDFQGSAAQRLRLVISPTVDHGVSHYAQHSTGQTRAKEKWHKNTGDEEETEDNWKHQKVRGVLRTHTGSWINQNQGSRVHPPGTPHAPSLLPAHPSFVLNRPLPPSLPVSLPCLPQAFSEISEMV